MHTTSPVRFFYAHAGWSYPTGATPAEKIAAKWAGARALAAAEKAAADAGLVAVWVADADFDPSDFDDPDDRRMAAEDGAVGCVLYRPCPQHGTDCKHAEVLGSLWGIVESRTTHEAAEYRRVIAAELALDALPDGGAQ